MKHFRVYLKIFFMANAVAVWFWSESASLFADDVSILKPSSKTPVIFDKPSQDNGPTTIGELKPYYSKYLKLKFEYPENWILQESPKKTRIIGIRNQDRTFSNSFVITRYTLKETNVEKLLGQKMKHIQSLRNSRILLNENVALHAFPEARLLDFTYELWLPFMNLEGKFTTLHENRYYVQTSNCLYQFALYTDEKDYSTLKDMFSGFLKSSAPY